MKGLMIEKQVSILFPLGLLKPGPELLDPDNTETIWEYYLLENISCGLVRDSKLSATGYEGCIADKFYKEDPKTWVFHIPHIQWSDGSNLTSEEILNWIKMLKDGHKRHITYIKLSNSIAFIESERLLKIQFPFEIDETILHELSLADSGLFPSNFKNDGWIKTIGPYFVKSWNYSENLLQLSANQHSPLFRKEMPKIANLTKLSNPNLRGEIFKSINFDVVPIVASANPTKTKLVLRNAPQIWSSHPMDISFFYFNYKNPQARDIKNRIVFANAVKELRGFINSLTDLDCPFSPEEQLIPTGFHGRISSRQINAPQKKLSELLKIKIRLNAMFKDQQNLTIKMKEVFLRHRIELEIEYSDRSEFNSEEFGGTYSFLGNQMDASGSFTFLTTPPYGPLSPWQNEYKNIQNLALSNTMLSDRLKNIEEFHEFILNKFIAVPLMIGTQRYLLSDRIDTSSWNQFDSRLRIYEIRWK
jgi:MarR-like DNA-binding transcriptional regulator SgrR of sgrS sRNA